jgi:Ran GTPase-activating protein (RanGAP) involved in mRNA processing and transport
LELILGHFVHTNEQPNGDNEITTRNDPILTVLNLSGNKIDSIGGRILGQMLQQNHSLIILNVNLNYLQDEGGLSLLRGLRDNCTLQCLEIASNQLSSQSASTLSSIIENHSPRSTKSNGPSSSGERNSTKKTMSNLEEVDLAANCFSEKDIIKFSKSMQGNCNLKLFDLRSQQPPQGHYKHFDEEIKTTKSLKMYENALENISKRLRMNKKSG